MKSILKFSLKTNIVKSLLSEIVSNVGRYYYTYGKSSPWGESDTPEDVSDSFSYETATRNEMLIMKRIDSNDVSTVIKRIDWIAGYTFDMYDEYSESNPAFSGATALENAEFYCLTEDYNVYKCLFNNNDKPSFIRPIGTSVTPFELDDGYVWKYMYTIPLSLRNKFLTSTTMPVITALANQFYSKGSIVSYSIENAGKLYPITSYKVIGLRIISGGSGYSGEPTIVISNPDQDGGVPATVAETTIVSGKITEIVLLNQGSGYSYPPTISISGGSPIAHAQLEPIIERIGSTYTTLSVVGDGVLEENPYEVQSINIISAGLGYQTITFLFTDPDLPNGIRAIASANINATTGAVESIDIDEVGYGYSKPFYSISQNSNAINNVRITYTSLPGQTASGFDFTVASKKNEAILKPIINTNGEIEQIIITNPGIGYTYATVAIDTSLDKENTPGFQEASILLNFGIGDIDSQQSTVEISAIPGAIHTIKVDDYGFGYTTEPTVEIIGDGFGCTAHAVIVDGTIDKIVVDSIGSNYTTATVNLIGPSGSQASAHAVISPKNGHGKDSVSELYAKTLVLHGNLSKEKNQSFAPTNSYRQVCIIKNPKEFSSDSTVRSNIASTCLVAIGAKGQLGYNSISQGDILNVTVVDRVYSYRVVEKNDSYSTTEVALLLSYLDNYIPLPGSVFAKLGAAFNSTSVIAPTVNKFSGDLITTDNRERFSPSTQQIVTSINSITF